MCNAWRSATGVGNRKEKYLGCVEVHLYSTPDVSLKVTGAGQPTGQNRFKSK